MGKYAAVDKDSDFRMIFDAISDAIFIIDSAGQILNANLTAIQRYGYSTDEFLQMNASELAAPHLKSEIASRLQKSQESAEQFEWVHQSKDGSELQVEIYSCPIIYLGQRVILSSVRDISRRKKLESLLDGQKQILEMIATGSPLPETLAALVRLIETQSPGMLGSILLLDDDGIHVLHGAAPNLPAAFVLAVNGQPIGPCAGSCGTAAYRKEAVFVEDIATDPLWSVYKAAALPHGLHACWSTPIFDAQQSVLGTFAMYYGQPGLPLPEHLRLIEIATHTAAIAISHHRTETALNQSKKRLRKLIDGLGPATFVGMMTTDGTLIEASQSALH